MAQSLLITSPSTSAIRSPVPKRFRFSLKHDKSLPQDPADYAVSPKTSVVSISKAQDDTLTDNYGVQDENVSPNCKVPEIKLSSFINLEVVDINNDIDALGLPNCGNTCYLNSILQVLRYTPNFLNCIHLLSSSQRWLNQVDPNNNGTKEADLFFKLHKLYVTMKKQEDFLYNDFEKDFSSSLMNRIESFLLTLREVSSVFEEGEQHDAHELLLTILSTFTSFYDSVKTSVLTHNSNQDTSTTAVTNATSPSGEILKLSQSKEKRKIKQYKKVDAFHAVWFQSAPFTFQDSFLLDFEGKMRHVVTCLECEKRSERDEPFTNLEISIADDLINEGSIDLCECLDHKIILSGENKYFCEDCFHLNEAELSSEIISLPSILLIHCSWLKQSSTVTRIEKDSTTLRIPMSLNTSENANIFHTSSEEIYCLYAIVLHLGSSTENGHYVSFIRDKPRTSEVRKNLSHSNTEECCANEGILNMKSSPVDRWLLFDDTYVTPVYVNEACDTFPYDQFLRIAASPCILFYYKL